MVGVMTGFNVCGMQMCMGYALTFRCSYWKRHTRFAFTPVDTGCDPLCCLRKSHSQPDVCISNQSYCIYMLSVLCHIRIPLSHSVCKWNHSLTLRCCWDVKPSTDDSQSFARARAHARARARAHTTASPVNAQCRGVCARA